MNLQLESQLNLEDQIGIIENKELKPLKKLFNMNENCYGTLFENKSLRVFKGEKLAHSYYMSPE